MLLPGDDLVLSLLAEPCGEPSLTQKVTRGVGHGYQGGEGSESTGSG